MIHLKQYYHYRWILPKSSIVIKKILFCNEDIHAVCCCGQEQLAPDFGKIKIDNFPILLYEKHLVEYFNSYICVLETVVGEHNVIYNV